MGQYIIRRDAGLPGVNQLAPYYQLCGQLDIGALVYYARAFAA